MARNTDRNPKSYEEIVRTTVVEPDSSARPTLGQEERAREGFRALDGDEQGLQDRVLGALASSGVGATVTVEVTRELVTLRGRVSDAGALRALEDAVARVPGVGTVHNKVVVG